MDTLTFEDLIKDVTEDQTSEMIPEESPPITSAEESLFNLLKQWGFENLLQHFIDNNVSFEALKFARQRHLPELIGHLNLGHRIIFEAHLEHWQKQIVNILDFVLIRHCFNDLLLLYLKNTYDPPIYYNVEPHANAIITPSKSQTPAETSSKVATHEVAEKNVKHNVSITFALVFKK